MTPDEIIQATLDNPNYGNLKKKVIELPGRAEPYIAPRKMVLVESCNALQFRRGMIFNAIQADETLTEEDKTFLVVSYLELASFSFGDVPTYKEYAFGMTNDDSVIWLEAMHEINPESVKVFFPEDEKTPEKKKADAKKK